MSTPTTGRPANTPLRTRTVSTNNANDRPANAARRAFKPRKSEPLRSSITMNSTSNSKDNKENQASNNKPNNTPNKQQKTPEMVSLTPTHTPSHTPQRHQESTPTGSHLGHTPIYSPMPPSERTTRSPLQSSISPSNDYLADITQGRTIAGLSIADTKWDLETADNDPAALDEDFLETLQLLSSQHSSTIISYKRLLESSQGSSAAQLYALQAEIRDMKYELSRLEKENHDLKINRPVTMQNFSSRTDLSNILRPNFDEIAVKRAVKQLHQDERLRLLRVVLESALPHDISTTIRMLEKYAASAFDVLGTLPEGISTEILSYLDVKEALNCKLISKRWYELMKLPQLWRAFVLRLTASDPDPVVPPENEENWESLYRALHFRERNWSKGIAQSIKFLPGHTNYVTSMQLKGGILVTGSYDQTLRIWDLKNGGECKSILQAKAISCLDYLPNHKILAAGYFDVGRVVVYSTLTNQPLQMLQGHNRGIRAVACNDEFLVSAGQDKALVVWNWRTGDRIARFGQQTNVSIGVQLIDADKFIAVTVDSIIRCFSITKREMTSQYRLSSLSPELSGIGYTADTMLTWFGAEGLSMTCATKNHLIHLQWDEGEEEVVLSAPAPAAPAPTSTLKPRTSRASIGAPLAKNGRSGPRKSGILPPPIRKNSSDETASDVNSTQSTSNPSVHSSVQSGQTQIKKRSAPILIKAPKVVQITHTQNMAPVGATDVSKHRVVTSTRFSSRSGADRRLFCSTLGETVPITGVWEELSPRPEEVTSEEAKESLANSNRGPLSICIDHQQAVFGCADGTLSFVGETQPSS
ncbi:hypothetical protein E3Q22_01307 [Wallemia mellicola]|uniref:F-box domain-containing protein n=1 Tax=Wallemia mellicola TaxID=1708541 RepID=A0A4T0NVK4_9BASI|nr:hypothetical protein E3Q22_01307 [Wallemia mellicola]TIB88076.1 hypothetical protein E3Q19_03422 [Wallemia mellicola]TIC00928.1 hypothetical protein E3Q18_00885 [Wallemia mellicola]TIC03973.1 hypothetical protein E3Q17_00674 [Wallemia mellicola]